MDKPLAIALTKYDLSNVGGPMGSDTSVRRIWTKYFKNISDAKDYAIIDHTKKHRGYSYRIAWKGSKYVWNSNDLGSHSYSIIPINLEKGYR